MPSNGSYWSRWDLHVHTPASYTHDYGGSDDVWERFIKDLESLPPDVSVVGINDYLEIEGYKRVIQERAQGRLSNLRRIFPVVEFRIARFAGQGHWQRVNLHVIFSDEVSPEAIEQEFLSSLHRKYNLDDGEVWGGPPLRRNLEELGRQLKAAAPAGTITTSDLVTGINAFNVEVDEIEELLGRSSTFRGRYLRAVGKAEWDQLAWTPASAAEKRSIINGVDFVFTACETDGQFLAGREKLRANTVQDRMLHCSDAHSLSTSGATNRIGNCLTWIKAEPCFDALVPARHEYEDRVFVGSEPPQHTKVREAPTRYLQSISFRRVSGTGAPWFHGAKVELNPGLVAVIGHKGSGKSALADCIALAGDADVEEHLSFLSTKRFRNPRTGEAADFEAEIEWVSKDCEQKLLSTTVDTNKPERVRYLPQNYFERLCADIGEEAYAEFERELKRVVFSWLPADRQLGKPTLDDLVEATTGEWRERRRLHLGKLSELNRTIGALERELSPDAERELRNKLAERKRELDAHVSNEPTAPAPAEEPTEEDRTALAAVETLGEQLKELEAEKTRQEATLSALRLTRQAAEDLRQRLENIQLYATQQLQASQALESLQRLEMTQQDLVTLTIDFERLSSKTADLEESIRQTNELLNANATKRSTLEDERRGLVGALDERRKLLRERQDARQRWEERRAELVGTPQLPGSIANIEHLLKELPKKVKLLHELENKRWQVFETLVGELVVLRDSYRALFEPVQQYLAEEELLADGLTMGVDALIRNDGFSQKFLESIDQSKRGPFYQGGEARVRDLLAQADFDSLESTRNFVQGVLDLIRPLDGQGRPSDEVEHQLRSRATREDVYDFLFGMDYLRPHYALKFNGKEIAQLSPGERGAALLIFYILVDRSDIPILLDQPEENLDNETVSSLLVPAIRRARQRRQVLIVTHNPNLAVYCDADQVILATLSRGTNARISYDSGAIERPETRRWLVNVLEGTGRAFLKRHVKYSIGEHGELVFGSS